MNSYVRKTWSILIEKGYDAGYSTALNFMLLGFTMEAIKSGGLDHTVRDVIWSFISDEKTINELNLEDLLTQLGEKIKRV